MASRDATKQAEKAAAGLSRRSSGGTKAGVDDAILCLPHGFVFAQDIAAPRPRRRIAFRPPRDWRKMAIFFAAGKHRT
jgi:hypothetical protein